MSEPFTASQLLAVEELLARTPPVRTYPANAVAPVTKEMPNDT